MTRLITRGLMSSGLAACVALLGGCFLQPNPTIDVESPAAGSKFMPGDTITLQLRVDNFELGPPADHMAAGYTGKSSSRMHDNGDDDHAEEHNPNPLLVARAGHYHIYLDEARGSDEHITAWTETIEVSLAEDLAAGPHSLRIELRDNNHNETGIETVWSFECVEP